MIDDLRLFQPAVSRATGYAVGGKTGVRIAVFFGELLITFAGAAAAPRSMTPLLFLSSMPGRRT
jgi:hypothetical protein